jgi:choline dehydrogenase-like flavoprotein
MSPKILQLSGIGPGAQLKSAGIDIVAESPDVGAKMHEHLGFAMSYRLKGTAGLNWRLHGLGLVASVAQYYLFHTGILAAGAYEVGAFARSQPGLNRPDIQVSLGALSFKRDPKGIALTSAVEHQPGFTISAQGIRLTSEGTVTVKSADPYAPLSILPNWLSTEYDRRTMIGAIKYMRRYVSQPALAPYVGEETRPGASVTSDEDILNAVRLLAHCGLHAVGTCRMGNDDNAVVDGDLRVKGIDGLRVADCSVMPNIVSGNTNGPAMALGWRAADIILKGRTA